MRIRQLRIKNFRRFEDVKFDFMPDFNLLVGINGSGKTSLLKAVISVLATPILGTSAASNWPHVDDDNARLALLETGGRVRFEKCYPLWLEADGDVFGKSREWWVSKDGPASQVGFEHTIYTAIADESAKIAQTGVGALPVVAFYSAARNWKSTNVTPDQAVQSQESRFDAYRSWSDASLDMKGLETWIIGKSLERLQSIAEKPSVPDEGQPDELALVNSAIAEALPGARGLRFDMKYRRLVLDWDKAPLVPFDTLSDGQRGVCALIADIARRMCLLNPHLGESVLTRSPGIVVIDELDVHLHPAWQRRICGVLRSVFPSVQFIAASHSPQIIGELEPESVLLLKDGYALGHPERSIGLTSGQVLEELMGSDSQSKPVAEALTRIRDALDNSDLDSGQTQLDTLRKKVGMIPDVLELQSSIDSLRLLGGEQN